MRLWYAPYEALLYEYYEPRLGLAELFVQLMMSACTKAEADAYYSILGPEQAFSLYRKGRRNFTVDILRPFKRPDVREQMLHYFAKNITAHIPPERTADMIRDLCFLIRSDESIARGQKDSLLALAKKETLNGFLAEMFLYAVKQDNISYDVPPEAYFPLNNFPFKKNLFFEGRETQLAHIRKQFGAGNVVSLTQTMAGTGGVGKTQIALEYGYRFAEEYDTVWWLGAETPQAMQRAVFEFLARKKLPEVCEDEAALRGAFLSWFERNEHWLLIFDNVDDFDAVVPFLPKNDRGNVLITTRLQRVTIGEKVDIAVFDEDEAVAFLLHRAGKEDSSGAAELAERLGYLPLALEQAAAYMANKKKMTFADYLALLDQYGLRVFEHNEEITDYKLPVTATWQISLEKIEMDSARQLLNIIAYFACERIPLSLFIKHAGCLPEPLRSEIQDRLLRDDIVDELTRYSLVKSEDTADGDSELSLHRLLQEVILNNIPDGESYLKCCLRIFFAACSSKDASERADFNTLIVHVNEVAARAEKQLTDPESRKLLMGVCHQIADYFSGQGDYPKALGYLKQTLRVCKALFGRSHRLTADLCGGIGRVYSAMKNYDRAIYYYQRAAKIQLDVFGKASPDVAGTYNNLASAYKNMGDHASAREWYEQSLDIKKEVLGPEHPDTLLTQCNMAQMVALLGDKENALALHQEVREARERVLGFFNDDTAVSYEHIALIHLELGNMEEALRWLHKARGIYLEIHGEENLTTAAVNHRIAYAYHHAGDLVQAMEFYHASLTVRANILGLNHPDTAATRNLMKQCKEQAG